MRMRRPLFWSPSFVVLHNTWDCKTISSNSLKSPSPFRCSRFARSHRRQRGPACIASIFPGSWDIIRKRCVDSAHDPITLEIVCSNDVLRYNNNCRVAPTLILTPPLKGRIGSGVVSISEGVTRRMAKAGSDCPFWREQDRRIIGLMQWLGWSG